MNTPALRPPAARPWWRRPAALCLAATGVVLVVGITEWTRRTILSPLPTIAGQPESCLSCHTGMTGFAPAHDPAAIGCATCHLGDRRARTAEGAHTGMTRTPGNLSLVRQTCASTACHEKIGDRVRGSLMATMSGVVAVDKFVFGENTDLDRPFDIARLGHSPADSHLRTLCASCHLGHDKLTPAPLDEASRGGGCSACHLDYGPRAAEELARRGKPGLAPLLPQAHPLISVRIPDHACFGCHSRSGRIATNYEGWHETLLDESAARQSPAGNAEFRVLTDGRVFEKKSADVHFERGLSCVDCHVAAEVMGDGTAHAHQENAVKIACIDCHANPPPATRTLDQLDPETRMIVTLRGLIAPERRYVAAASGDTAHANTFTEAGGPTRLIRQRDGATLNPKPVTAACGRGDPAHAALDCRACHSAWTSQCVSCHTVAAPRTPAWDYLAGQETTGTWTEHAGEFFADPPTLGVTTNRGAEKRITTFAPGMIMTLNRGDPTAPHADEFHRLFAPVSPHTTSARARDCRSCHNTPSALGYGRGQLVYEVRAGTGTWRFTPELPPRPEDGLPRDAWIGFLRDPSAKPSTTRTNARPFSVGEQQTILRVGACLSCHSSNSVTIAPTAAGFAAQLTQRSPRCVLPAWPNESSPPPP